VVPRLAELRSNRMELSHLRGLTLFHLDQPRPRRVLVKEVLDRSLAAVLLICMAPPLLAAALAVKLSSRGPVLFRQRRVGRDGRVFEMLKFRSMRLEDVEPGRQDGAAAELVRTQSNLSRGLGPGGDEGVDRRTTVGRFLRSTSLDELPQLLEPPNVTVADARQAPARTAATAGTARSSRRHPRGSPTLPTTEPTGAIEFRYRPCGISLR
jgi:lipopolysaccharide/colanic/teichoic acid biosynthesis glycosyltransferase